MSTVVMQPGGPGGGALWPAEKACCRQAKQSRAVPKARLRKLVMKCVMKDKINNIRALPVLVLASTPLNTGSHEHLQGGGKAGGLTWASTLLDAFHGGFSGH